MHEETEHIGETNIDDARIQAAVEKAKQIDIDTLLKAFVEVLRAYAEMAQRIGSIQKENKEAFEAITYLGSIAPQMLKMISQKAPPAEFGAFIKTLMDLVELAPKLDDLMKLSAEEKIETGRRLDQIAKGLEEMMSKFKEVKESGKAT